LKFVVWSFFCGSNQNSFMAEQRFEVTVDGVPYAVTASPFRFNEETRYNVRYNGNDYIFSWDPGVGRLAPIDEDGVEIPDNLEEVIAQRLRKFVV
jgi:hypothetical protein